MFLIKVFVYILKKINYILMETLKNGFLEREDCDSAGALEMLAIERVSEIPNGFQGKVVLYGEDLNSTTLPECAHYFRRELRLKGFDNVLIERIQGGLNSFQDFPKGSIFVDIGGYLESIIYDGR